MGIFASDVQKLFKNYSVQIKKRHNPQGHVHTKLALKYQIFVLKLFRRKKSKLFRASREKDLHTTTIQKETDGTCLKTQ